MNTRDFILKIILRLKPKPSRINSKLIQKSTGFTLIELLVALLISFLILTPLLGLMVNILTTDREEQAKANTEEDIQTAINYITRDLQQAIYVYDADGIAAISSQLRYPSDSSRTPILVFWKRDLVTNVVPQATGLDDTFIYSLVVYYLDNSASTTWSKAARISRWQIRNGVENSSGVNCTGYTKKYVSGYCPDPGFGAFNNYFGDGDNLTVGMQKWKKASGA
ncbi:MAG: hormogonium polysaccharide secretion pseudopilin HpsC, partial [Sphaerospermopsis kisseleviana]